MAANRQLTRREILIGTLMVGIISSGAIGGALLRDEHQVKQARQSFAALTPSDKLERLESTREGLLKRQMLIERKLDISREQRGLRERAREIGAQAQIAAAGSSQMKPSLPRQDTKDDSTPSKFEDMQIASSSQQTDSERSNRSGGRGWKAWLGFS